MKCTFGKYVRYISVALLLCCGTGAAVCAAPQWEVVNATSDESYVSAAPERLETTVRGGYLYVTTNRPVNIRLFTILGQLVSSRSLPAGTSRIRLATRGMYILKSENTARRISF